MFYHADKSTRGYILRKVISFLLKASLPYFVILFLNLIISYFQL